MAVETTAETALKTPEEKMMTKKATAKKATAKKARRRPYVWPSGDHLRVIREGDGYRIAWWLSYMECLGINVGETGDCARLPRRPSEEDVTEYVARTLASWYDGYGFAFRLRREADRALRACERKCAELVRAGRIKEAKW